MEFPHTASLGGGVIGASWTALFLASGRSVAVFDPDPEVETKVRAYIDMAWPTMEALGLTVHGTPDAVTFASSAAEAVEGADFIQESVPERLPIKHATFAEIEPVLSPTAVVASSASGLTLHQMGEGWRKPARFVLGHPFNPPHLVPLVEVMGGEATDADVVSAAERFYEAVGKTTIRVKKGVPGHVANRLQAALWREAIHLVMEGVASVEDVDKAISAGPGLRWAAVGPSMQFSLSAGPGGMQAFFDHFKDTFNGWWDDLGQVYLDDEVIATMVEGVAKMGKGKSVAELSAERDRLVLAIEKARREAG